jgi:hypothetical protein
MKVVNCCQYDYSAPLKRCWLKGDGIGALTPQYEAARR